MRSTRKGHEMTGSLYKIHDDAVDAEALLSRARNLVPLLAAKAPQAERDRRVSEEVIEALQDAGLFRVLQPQRWDGHELGLEVASEIQMILAEGCVSTAWVFGVLAVEPFLIAICDDRMAAEIWSDDPSVLISGTSARLPQNTSVAVEGGLRISGRWRFASGCMHADWTFLGGCTVTEADGSVTDWRVLLPRADYEIVDAWNVAGLRATGSQDILVEDVFVPAHRAIRTIDLFNCRGPGLAVNEAPMYRIPFGQAFALSVSTVAVGGLKGMLDAFIAYGSRRVGVGVGPTAMDPTAQQLCAEAQATIAEIKVMVAHNIAQLMAHAERGAVPPIEQRMFARHYLAYAVDRADQLAGRIFRACGGSALYVENSPLARFRNDIAAARQHVNNQVEAHGRRLGFVMLGGEPDSRDIFL